MLVELRIRDYAVIAELSLELRPGLNVLTGETGAGKSIIVGALSLLMGERASSDVVRAGREKALIEGVFDVSGKPEIPRILDDRGIAAEEGLVILRREVAAEGRNRAWVNGSPSTAGLVGELGTALVDLHGQHEHQTLLKAAEQREILDAFAGCEDRVREVGELHGTLRELRKARDEREARRAETRERVDLLRHQLRELDAADLEEGEEEALEEEAHRLEHSEEILELATSLYDSLYAAEGSVADRLAELRERLERLVRFDPSLEGIAGSLSDAYHAVDDVGVRLGDYATSVEHDPGRLEEIRQRQDLIFRLKRKYGPEYEDVLETRGRVREELEGLETADAELEEMERRIADAEAELRRAADALTEAREEAAERLAGAVRELLPDLGMEGARFEVELRPRQEIGARGAERVEFVAALNPGFDPGPLSRIASGGELSRVMLVLKAILARVDRVPTLVFDEIDVGIGGRVGLQVGEKLRQVADHHQVFVITHLPQIASRAHNHLFVEKGERAGMATTRVAELAGEGRIREVARMLGGDPESSTSLEHARELLTVGQG